MVGEEALLGLARSRIQWSHAMSAPMASFSIFSKSRKIFRLIFPTLILAQDSESKADKMPGTVPAGHWSDTRLMNFFTATSNFLKKTGKSAGTSTCQQCVAQGERQKEGSGSKLRSSLCGILKFCEHPAHSCLGSVACSVAAQAVHGLPVLRRLRRRRPIASCVRTAEWSSEDGPCRPAKESRKSRT